jgi:hypothetical protein
VMIANNSTSYGPVIVVMMLVYGRGRKPEG